MNTTDLLALLPLIVLAASAVATMLAIAARRRHELAASVAGVGMALALVSLAVALSYAPRQVTPLLLVDRYGLLLTGLILAAGLVILMIAYDYLRARLDQPEEFYVLLLLAMIGGATLVVANHFASFFLGLELLSVSLYALIAYRRTSPVCVEAGLKYLVLAAGSSAFLLFGMGLVYFELGTLRMSTALLGAGVHHTSAIVLAGLGMILVGIGFKLALVPFHFWAPDVYQGAPAPVTALVAGVSKVAVFALLLRHFRPSAVDSSGAILDALMILAAASMFVGNLLALREDNVKRLLAYSSIAQMGYIFVAFLAGGTLAVPAVIFYLAAYTATTLGALGVVTVLSPIDRDADRLEDYLGLATRRPWLAAVFTAMLLSLAGLPLTAGFIGKFYLLAAGVDGRLWLLASILVINSAIGLYYYVRVVVAMYAPTTGTVPEAQLAPRWLPPLAAAGLALATLGVLWLGIYPAPLLTLIQSAPIGG
jgi:NADH-quinone oxidoreductase subunit N